MFPPRSNSLHHPPPIPFFLLPLLIDKIIFTHTQIMPSKFPWMIDLENGVVVVELFVEAAVWVDYWALEFEPGEGLSGGEAVAEG